MSSNSIPLQSMSRWSLDSDDYHAHVDIQNQLHSQHPQLPPIAQLCSMQSQSALSKSYAIGDKVLFKGSPEPYIFFGEKQIHQHDNRDKMNTWQSLGLPGNHHTLPNQFSSNSIIKSNKITSLPLLVSCPGIGSRKNFRDIVASDSPLS